MSKFPVVRDLCVGSPPAVPRARKSACLDRRRRLLRSRAARASRSPAGAGLSAQRVHELRLLSGGVSAVRPARDAARVRRNGRTISRPARRGVRSVVCGATRSARRCITNSNPTGKLNADTRIDALMAPGGIQVCGNAQNCVGRVPQVDSADDVDRTRGPRGDGSRGRGGFSIGRRPWGCEAKRVKFG